MKRDETMTYGVWKPSSQYILIFHDELGRNCRDTRLTMPFNKDTDYFETLEPGRRFVFAMVRDENITIQVADFVDNHLRIGTLTPHMKQNFEFLTKKRKEA